MILLFITHYLACASSRLPRHRYQDAVDGCEIEQVKKFTYQGSVLSDNALMTSHPESVKLQLPSVGCRNICGTHM